MARPVVFSGIQPTGAIHIGNYFGAIKHWVAGQDDAENIFCLVDMHALTVPQEPAALRGQILETAMVLLAAAFSLRFFRMGGVQKMVDFSGGRLD